MRILTAYDRRIKVHTGLNLRRYLDFKEWACGDLGGWFRKCRFFARWRCVCG